MNPVLAMIIANVIWGAAAPIFKYALNDIPPFTFLFIRFFIAAFIFYPTIKGFNFRSLSNKDWIEIILGTIMGFTIHIGLLFVGLQKTESINSSVIVIGSPILLFIFSVLFLHEKIHKKLLGGLLISTVGVLFIVFSPLLLNGSLKESSTDLEGNLLYLGSMIGNVLSILLFKRVATKISPYALTFLSFAISSATFFPFMIRELGSWNFTMLGSEGMIGIFYGVFFSSAIAYYLYFYGLSKMSGEEVGIFGYLNPIFTVLVAIPLLKEIPSLYFIIGSVFIFTGMMVSELKVHVHFIHQFKGTHR